MGSIEGKVRSAWVEISKENIIHNFMEVKRAVGKDVKICPIVKANCYGMGATEISKIYLEKEAYMFAVAIISEAIELRQTITDKDILILGYTSEEFFDDAINNNITLTIYEYESAVSLNKIAENLNKTANIHIKVDTGMNRLGFFPTEENAELIKKISNLKNVKIQGIYSHFARADEKDKSYTCKQFNSFISFIKTIEEKEVNIPLKHIANSAAIIDFPEYFLDMVRPGIILTGFYPSDEVDKNKYIFKPCITLKAKISYIKTIDANKGIGYGHSYITKKETVVGTIPLGYADGYSRLLSNRAYVVVKDVKCPVLGKICMDQFMIDLSNVENPQIGDTAIIYGEGTDKAMTADDVARMRDTISYEVLTNLSCRLPRIYV